MLTPHKRLGNVVRAWLERKRPPMNVSISDWVEITSDEIWMADGSRKCPGTTFVGQRALVIGKSFAKAGGCQKDAPGHVPEFLLYRLRRAGLPDIIAPRWTFKVLQHAGDQ